MMEKNTRKGREEREIGKGEGEGRKERKRGEFQVRGESKGEWVDAEEVMGKEENV